MYRPSSSWSKPNFLLDGFSTGLLEKAKGFCKKFSPHRCTKKPVAAPLAKRRKLPFQPKHALPFALPAYPFTLAVPYGFSAD